MAITNNWTQQANMTATGETGVQVTRFMPACRAFVKTKDSVTAAPVNDMAAFSKKTYNSGSGATTVPSGWDDLGAMLGTGKMTYTKTLKKIQSGIDKVTRAVYVDERSCTVEFVLSQLDDVAMTKLGFVTSVITAGSTKTFQIGAEDIIEKALLMVYSNKLDGKEIQWYHPAAQIAAQIDEQDEAAVIKVTAELVAFTPAGGYTSDSLVSCTVFAA